jgi:putative transposase
VPGTFSLDSWPQADYRFRMGRPLRAAEGGLVYHVLNRANGRLRIFKKAGDYAAFEKVMAEAQERIPMRLLAYCLMPNHWHLVLWPAQDGALSAFTGWLTLTHTQRWHAHHQTAGIGHVYQGRFKSFPVAGDESLWVVCRYVERNALRAGLVEKAEAWRWGSLWHRLGAARPETRVPELAAWPSAPPGDYRSWVNAAQTAVELEALRRCVARGRPYGPEAWVQRVAKKLGLEKTLRPRGRPKKKPENKKGS